MEDLVYEFFKITAQHHRHFTLPSNGSGYKEAYSTSKLGLSDIDPEDIVLVKGGKEDTVIKQVRLMDAGYEMLHPRVLLALLQAGKMPEDWKDKYNIDFLGAWFCSTRWNGFDCNPLVLSAFFHDGIWKVSYDDIKDGGYDHYIAVIEKAK